MAFVFRAEKKLDFFSNRANDKTNNKTLDNYQYQMIKEINDSNSKTLKSNESNQNSIPFLSGTFKLIDKIEVTPGPGQYNIDDNPNNLPHKQYIKKNKIKYKDSLNDHYSYFNHFDLKRKNSNPGPGDYNPGANEFIGVKNTKYLKKNNSFSSYSERFPKINNKNNISENENKILNKNITINYIKINTNGRSTLYKNKKNDYDFHENYSLTRRTQSYSMKELFKNLLNNHKLRSKSNDTNSSTLLKDTSSIIYHVNNNNNNLYSNNSKCNSSINDISNMNTSQKSIGSRSFRSMYKKCFIKERPITKINTELEENIYYLNEFINSKYFSQVPGPGYYFSKEIGYDTTFKNNSYNDNYATKSNNFKIIFKNNIKDNDMNNIALINRNYYSNKNSKKTKTMKELKSDFRKKIFEKEKEVLLRNQRSEILKSFIAEEKLKEKEKKSLNLKKSYKVSGAKNYISLNSKEERFKGHSGYQNEVYKNDNPGPGEYDVYDNDCITKKNSNVIYNQLKKILVIRDDYKDRKFFIDEIKDTNPPVGYYRSDLIGTIDFNNKMKNLKWVDKSIKNGSLENIKIMTEKRVKQKKEKEEQIKRMLGPFSYFSQREKPKHNYMPNIGFGSYIERKKDVNEKKKDTGPRNYNYNIDLNQKWIKKSFNVLFA